MPLMTLVHPTTDFTASELAGSLISAPDLAHYSLADLESVVLSAGETLRDALFTVGDAALEYCRRAGDKPSERAKALETLRTNTGVAAAELRQAVRVARAFPYAERQQFAGQPKSWFCLLTDRTGLPGDTPEARDMRRREYAERCADLAPHEARALIDAELRTPQRGEFLEIENAPLPTKAPPVGLRPLTPAEERFGKLLHTAYRREQPGTAALVVEMVLGVLREGWLLTETGQ